MPAFVDTVSAAKKLKQSWVQTQKIRSQWKAQKHKEGLVSSRLTVPDKVIEESSSQIADSNDEMDANRKIPNVADTSPEGGNRPEEDAEVSQDEDGTYSQVCSRGKVALRRGKPSTRRAGRGRGGGGIHRQGRQSQHDEIVEDEGSTSIRDLQNEAYSRASLHTFKSNRSRGSASSHDSRDPSRRKGSQTGVSRSRGQPDMRLRMNVMLEKIKRDLI